MSSHILEINQGGTVDFTDASVGNIVSYDWYFPGGSPTGSTSPNPSVNYTDIGTFNVTLNTTDAYGVTATRLKQNIIEVSAAPWGVSFTIDPDRTLFMGEDVNFTNTSIGTPTYTQWNFPSGGGITPGITFGYKADLGPLNYLDWNQLTGSHIALAGSVYTSNVTLFAYGDFNVGSYTDTISVKKMGPLEYYYMNMDYTNISMDTSYLGTKISKQYGEIAAPQGIVTGDLTHRIGLNYTYATGGTAFNDYHEPYLLAGNTAVYNVDFNSQFGWLYWGTTGPSGAYYPHSNGERATIIGRATPYFNAIRSSLLINSADTGNTMGLRGLTADVNITQGNYSTTTSNEEVNPITNPNFLLIKDNYGDSGISPFKRSMLTHFVKDDLVVTSSGPKGFVKIPLTTLNKLMSEPSQLPEDFTGALPGSGKPIGMTTSCDTHISSDSYYSSGVIRGYTPTGDFIATRPGATQIGIYPCVPSQYMATTNFNTDLLDELPGAPGSFTSETPPLSLVLDVYYRDAEDQNPFSVTVYFGNPDDNTRNLYSLQLPSSIDPAALGMGGTGTASAYGNDQPNGCWILPNDTPWGMGLATYINESIADPTIGLPGGTADVKARADRDYVLPFPYSDNTSGTVDPSSGGTAYVGLAIEVLNPKIYKVEITEGYGRLSQMYMNVIHDDFMAIPMTWDYGKTTPTGTTNYPPYQISSELNDTTFTYLGISSRIIPFGYGVLGYGPSVDGIADNEVGMTSGIWFGGELK